MEAESRLESSVRRRRAEDLPHLLLTECHGLHPGLAELAQPRDDFSARRARILGISGDKAQRVRVTVASSDGGSRDCRRASICGDSGSSNQESH